MVLQLSTNMSEIYLVKKKRKEKNTDIEVVGTIQTIKDICYQE